VFIEEDCLSWLTMERLQHMDLLRKEVEALKIMKGESETDK
jgi:hypothetical protein